MKTKTKEPLVEKPALTKDNIILFADAIFSIAITLLALEVRLPDTVTHENFAMAFNAGLTETIPQFIGFLISFFVLASYWLSFHKVTGYMKRFDRRAFWLTMLFLFLIALMPFPTAILGDFSGEGAAVIFYQVVAAITSAILFIIWIYAIRSRLVIPAIDRRILDLYTVRLLMPAGVFLLTIPLTMYSPIIAQISWVSILPLSYLSRLYFRVEDPRYYE